MVRERAIPEIGALATGLTYANRVQRRAEMQKPIPHLNTVPRTATESDFSIALGSAKTGADVNLSSAVFRLTDAQLIELAKAMGESGRTPTLTVRNSDYASTVLLTARVFGCTICRV
ncbi:hypothetical protein CBM2585_A60246 [Cupriavidus taiwanensis]|nr:hypothetical protein CBM2585_A60246 [Cupriavidus taiwanensis]